MFSMVEICGATGNQKPPRFEQVGQRFDYFSEGKIKISPRIYF